MIMKESPNWLQGLVGCWPCWRINLFTY